MLKLVNITKTYVTGDLRQEALDGISISFRKNEFVSVLGQSGSGKTTLLNIIGGLDQYTTGDLIINGKSTREYTDKDWDTYRNHSIGFVFQSYNLIPHQTVLRNVELALTLSGVSRSERRRRALEALEAVGLSEHIHKRPNQMSGGQMQRVSIARALINNPDILLADEPTGALDSETSVQVMELLKEIAKDRLVIMVTHNPELAEAYSTRIVKLFDGKVTSDSDPYEDESQAEVLTREQQKKQKSERKKRSMSYLTALSLSLNNLMTKKGRTILTAFAGSIGIIGIALILSLSTGINNYIDDVQEETLTSYPVTIQAEAMDMGAMMLNMMGARQEALEEPREDDRVYTSTVMFDMLNTMATTETKKNNLRPFKTFLDGNEEINKLATVHYSYDIALDVYNADENGDIVQNDVTALMQEAMGAMFGGNYSMFMDTMGGMYSEMIPAWSELMPGADGALVDKELMNSYEMVYGAWPAAADEVILFVDRNNEISDMMLYILGYLPKEQMTETLKAMQQAMLDGTEVSVEERSWTYEELCNAKFRLILPAERYRKDASGRYVDLGADPATLEVLYKTVGTPLKVVGIARPVEDGSVRVQGAIGYTSALTHYAIERSANTEVVKEQLANPDVDVFTGLPFPKTTDREPTEAEKLAAIREHLSTLTAEEKAEAYVDMMGQVSDEELEALLALRMQELDRAAIEQMIAEEYSAQVGVDKETLLAAVAGMTDEELGAMVLDFARDMVRQQAAEMARQQLAGFSAEELAAMLDAAMSDEPVQAPTDAEKLEAVRNYVAALDTEQKAAIYLELMCTPSPETVDGTVAAQLQEMDRAAMEALLVQMANSPAAESAVAAMTDEELTQRAGEALALVFRSQYEAGVRAGLEALPAADRAAALDLLLVSGMMEPWQAAFIYDSWIAAPEAGVKPFETWQLLYLYDNYMPATRSSSTYEDNIKTLNFIDEDNPSVISIYCTSFADKDRVADIITEYNKTAPEDDKISYTDYIALLMSSITDIINAISYLLIAFVSISLIVSSIMIGVITYISVLERTKEIGILRAIGASKRDISRVFNAETLIVGLGAGLMGILVTLLILIPANIILHKATGISNLTATLPVGAAVILVAISAVLTIIAGLLPAKLAARKNPVEALRTE